LSLIIVYDNYLHLRDIADSPSDASVLALPPELRNEIYEYLILDAPQELHSVKPKHIDNSLLSITQVNFPEPSRDT